MCGAKGAATTHLLEGGTLVWCEGLPAECHKRAAIQITCDVIKPHGVESGGAATTGHKAQGGALTLVWCSGLSARAHGWTPSASILAVSVAFACDARGRGKAVV